MENDHLRILTEKTWDLHGRISDKINQTSFSFCRRHCSNHGRYCVVAPPPEKSSLEEMEKMVVLRDSVKDLHTILIFLQRVKASQKRQREEAFGRLEESRKILRDRISECRKKGRKNLGVILQEIMTFVGDDENFNYLNMDNKIKIIEQDKKTTKKNKKKKSLMNGICGFLIQSTRFGLEFLLMFASIYTSVKLCEDRKQIHISLEREVDSDIHLDVFCGRG